MCNIVFWIVVFKMIGGLDEFFLYLVFEDVDLVEVIKFLGKIVWAFVVEVYYFCWCWLL